MSPSFAAPAVAPAIHDQGLRRLTELIGLIPVEYPTTRRLDATAQDRAADLNTAFADPSIRAVLATIGGQIRSPWCPYWIPKWSRITARGSRPRPPKRRGGWRYGRE